jgi:hypothetical protein
MLRVLKAEFRPMRSLPCIEFIYTPDGVRGSMDYVAADRSERVIA